MTQHGRILVGVSNSEHGRRALRWAAEEASARGAEIQLLRAYHLVNGSLPGEATSDRIIRADLRRAALRTLTTAQTQVRETWPDLRVTTDAADGIPANMLVTASARADLTVVGSRNLGPVGAAVLEGTSTVVAARARGPVVVVEGIAGLGAERAAVVVGVDGSHSMHAVLGFAFDYADRHDRAVHVILCGPADPLATAGWMLPTSHEDLDRWMAETIAGWQNEFPSTPISSAVVLDRPVHGLVAASAGQAMLVVGSRSRHPRLATMLGSVSQGVLHHATCPVAVVHPDDTARPKVAVGTSSTRGEGARP